MDPDNKMTNEFNQTSSKKQCIHTNTIEIDRLCTDRVCEIIQNLDVV